MMTVIEILGLVCICAPVCEFAFMDETSSGLVATSDYTSNQLRRSAKIDIERAAGI
jgi:hypothetical protein